MNVLLEMIKKGVKNPARAVEYLAPLPIRAVSVAHNSRSSQGVNVFSRDWDVLVVLDTCRVDAISELADEYEFLDNSGQIWSVGGSSPEWMAKTFSKEHISETTKSAYVTPNGWAERVLEEQMTGEEFSTHNDAIRMRRYGRWDTVERGEIGKLEHIWKYFNSSNERKLNSDFGKYLPEEYQQGRAPPRYVTDRGIEIGRKEKYDRLILHYTQPHSPYLSGAIDESRGLYEFEENPFEFLREGGDRSKVWQAYLHDLKWVLDDVRLLLNNIDADKVAITADHGEAFGEYGIHGHHAGSVHPQIRRVPWITTTASDEETYIPKLKHQETKGTAEDTLKALGYI